jgi:hypothetical protein
MREKRTMANMKALRQDLKAKEAKEISVWKGCWSSTRPL